MNWKINFKNWLNKQLNSYVTNDYVVKVVDEVDFGKVNENNTIEVILKFNSGVHINGALVQPLQLVAFSEKNSIEIATKLLNDFVDNLDQYQIEIEEDKTAVFECYTPMVLTNFEQVGDGYTSQIIVNGTLVIKDNIVDYSSSLSIDDYELSVNATQFSYQISSDIQPQYESEISKNLKKTAVNEWQFTSLNSYDINDLNHPFHKFWLIANGLLDGNTTFTLKMGGITTNCILTSYTFGSSVSNPPTLATIIFKLATKEEFNNG